MFAIRLKELRNQRNLTQLEVGKYIGVTRSTVAGYECKGKEPSFAILIAIADFFDVSLDYLLGRKEPTIDNSYKDVFKDICNLSDYIKLNYDLDK